ncbi:MAG: hypothetical protein HQL59_02340 [Magnetococcales bacterium]|nr:hypothetical protein [Magnetococcales bacterium]
MVATGGGTDSLFTLAALTAGAASPLVLAASFSGAEAEAGGGAALLAGGALGEVPSWQPASNRTTDIRALRILNSFMPIFLSKGKISSLAARR